MATWEDVRRIAGSLPETVESTHYGDPSFKVADRAFVTLTRRFENAIVIRCTEDEQQLLVSALPDVYFITPHYAGWSGVVMHLDAASGDELAGALEDSYAFVKALPPKRVRRPSGSRTRPGSR